MLYLKEKKESPSYSRIELYVQGESSGRIERDFFFVEPTPLSVEAQMYFTLRMRTSIQACSSYNMYGKEV